ncbi:U6 small nuclear RNA (adenine-(43)-N(6))-methyltransferase [Ischnura elegans]|uniref:U6 small nuclear RNA (adenine-(43)-N(6))-methyltransferase n=1 Tax=Ischnura elegans TaxID=197161 RepID=UPI001ED8B954|nr:U6 small nuclear RNA (adenine-(43)-N(6))-methyltransferase [Ischnura elegans]
MSMNKFMHPRNIYRNPPNFKELAIQYPEFRKHSKQELSGKVTIDFKDPAALRALTTTLLLKDFNLTVEIPLNRLVPTLPLRLNYLLWIEDLLAASKLTEEIYGVDIGTGASCIYPLLAGKTKGWRMLATEIDEESVACAIRNVEANGLETLIEVKRVDANVILDGALEGDKHYTFTMCNPPFFESEKDVIASDNRSSNRTPPSNSPTGSMGELVVDGGELKFIRKMLSDSKDIGTRVSLYTTMVGHKSNVNVLKAEIAAAGANNYGSYEFCQGRTTRWGLAWTFKNDVKTMVDGLVANKKSKLKPPFSYVVPSKDAETYTIEAVVASLKEICCRLELERKEVKKSKVIHGFVVTAWRNTWAKQRHKRRLAQGRAKEPSGENAGKEGGDVSTGSDGGPVGDLNSSLESSPPPVKRSRLDSDISEEGVPKAEDVISSSTSGGASGTPNKGLPLLKASLVVKCVESDIVIEMAWLEGLSGRDAVHQVLQYIKNNLKC